MLLATLSALLRGALLSLSPSEALGNLIHCQVPSVFRSPLGNNLMTPFTKKLQAGHYGVNIQHQEYKIYEL